MLPDTLRGLHTHTLLTGPPSRSNQAKEGDYSYILEQLKPQHHKLDQPHGQMSLRAGRELESLDRGQPITCRSPEATAEGHYEPSLLSYLIQQELQQGLQSVSVMSLSSLINSHLLVITVA